MYNIADGCAEMGAHRILVAMQWFWRTSKIKSSDSVIDSLKIDEQDVRLKKRKIEPDDELENLRNLLLQREVEIQGLKDKLQIESLIPNRAKPYQNRLETENTRYRELEKQHKETEVRVHPVTDQKLCNLHLSRNGS